MREYLKEDRKVLLNAQRLGVFLKEFSRCSMEEKVLCVQRIEDKYVDEFVEFFNCYIKIVNGKVR
jgi:hypothetical protein